jgi:rod shape-determining protein MreC
MESFLNRYRAITVLLLVIFAQLVLLAVQVKNDRDVPAIRVWTVTAVMPFAHLVEMVRGGTAGLIRNYILLKDAGGENRGLRAEVGRLKLENTFLKNELNTADRAKALQIFQANTPSKTLAANVIGVGAGSNSKVVFVNRGSVSGVERGMAVVTPDGIVGKVIAAYPTSSQVLLITDPEFAAGVISQKAQVRGTLKGQGTPMCKVDYVPIEEKVEVGEMFYTSGDDRIFPRGFAAGVVRVVRKSSPFQEIYVEPTGLQHGVEDVLILIEGVHQDIPETPPANQPVYIGPAPPADAQPAPAAGTPGQPGTAADRLRTEYQAVGEAQNHIFGEGPPGTKPPDFTKLPVPGAPVTAPPKAAAPPPAAALGEGTQPPAAAHPAAPGEGTQPPAAAHPPASGGGTPAPPVAHPAAPGEAPSRGPGKTPGTPSVKPAPKTVPDAVRRINQAAGAPSGGRIER